MDRAYLLEGARRLRGLTQAQLAAMSGTSQAALSAYERGLKSPTLKVASRILEATGHDFALRVHIDWTQHHPRGIVPFWAPNILWRVELPDCFATLEIPDLINDGPTREWDMRDREQRKGVYEQLIRRGLPQQMIRWMDGALLVDVWDELDLPGPVREVWKWPIAIAREPTKPNPLGFSGDDAMRTSSAWIRRYDALPKPPPRRQRRTRFDPRLLPPEDQSPRPGGRDDEAGGR